MKRELKRCGPGFTLVELLVVIGIIGLLVGILLPTLNRAKESSRRVQCLSNLKQLANATLMYCNDNQGAYPGRAGQGTDAGDGSIDPQKYWGWIAWRRRIDVVVNRTYPGTWDQNITFSALARYLGGKAIDHNPERLTTTAVYRQAHSVNETLEKTFRCPSDDIRVRVAFATVVGLVYNETRGPYRYSYSMNIMFGDKGYDATLGQMVAHRHRRMQQVRLPTQKIIFIDESEMSVNNGECNPTVPLANTDIDKDYTAIAERHELKVKKNSQDARGNVAFADGHAEFFSRRDFFQPKYFDPDWGR